MSQNYDLIIIGGGPGGYIAAIRAAQLGAKVCLIEKDKVGGTCLNRGCIPTKAIIACTNLYEKMLKAESYGISCSPSLHLSISPSKIVERKNKIVSKIVKGVEFLLSKNKVEVIHGTATVLGPGKVEIKMGNGERGMQNGKKIILATGSSPACLPGTNFDGEKFLCSDDILDHCHKLDKLDIVGGGVIGLHFAQIYSALGTEVTIHEALPEILPGIDEEVVAMVKRILKRRKINIITNTRFDPAKSCGKTLICIGRIPNLKGLENLKLKTENNKITVDEKQETNIPNIYAVGDLVSPKQFAHVAYEQGVIAAENAMGGNRTFNYDCVPYGIYTHPEIGAVGLTEKEAPNAKVGKFPYAALGIAQAMGEIEGFIKVISDAKGKLLGIHILGAEATTLIGAATIALKNGLTVDQLAETFQGHPSFPEGLHEAALSALKRSLHQIQ
ncbi:dihydrolipoyl dehydrogenase [Candidatus Margulisiibacteriota bacterium]